MAAVGCHIVAVQFVAVNPQTGQVVSKDDPNTTISDVLHTAHDHRIISDSSVPSSSGSPTIKNYLLAEAAAGYKLVYMDQTKIITYM